MSSGELIAVLAAGCVVLAALAIFLLRLLRRRRGQKNFALYARERGLEPVAEELPGATPILYRGSERVTRLAFRGELSKEREGTIAHYTYTERIPVPSAGGGGGGGVSAANFDLTVVLIEVPETHGTVPKLLCHGRHGAENTDKFDDALGRKGFKRLKLESAALNRRFEIFYAPDQDEVRLRRLLAPATIVWLAEEMPTAFELVNGHLCCFAAGHLDSATELDTLIWGAAELAYRLESEPTEQRFRV
jgi:hypothetical protein